MLIVIIILVVIRAVVVVVVVAVVVVIISQMVMDIRLMRLHDYDYSRVADGETEQPDLKIRNSNDVALTEVSITE